MKKKSNQENKTNLGGALVSTWCYKCMSFLHSPKKGLRNQTTAQQTIEEIKIGLCCEVRVSEIGLPPCPPTWPEWPRRNVVGSWIPLAATYRSPLGLYHNQRSVPLLKSLTRKKKRLLKLRVSASHLSQRSTDYSRGLHARCCIKWSLLHAAK